MNVDRSVFASILACVCGASLVACEGDGIQRKRPTSQIATSLTGYGNGVSSQGMLQAVTVRGDKLRYWQLGFGGDVRPGEYHLEGQWLKFYNRILDAVLVEPASDSNVPILNLYSNNNGEQKAFWVGPESWYAELFSANAVGDMVVVYRETLANGRPERYDRHYFRVKIAILSGKNLKREWVGLIRDTNHSMNLSEVAMSDNGAYVAIAGWKNGIALLDVAQQQLKWARRPQKEVSTTSVAFSVDGKSVFAGGGAGSIFEISSDSGKILRTYSTLEKGQRVGSQRIVDVAVSSDGKLVAAGTEPLGLTVVWETETAKEKTRFVHGGGIWQIAFSPDSTHLASMSTSLINIWRID